MAIFPRKYRSLLYKLVVIVPVLWLTVMLIAHNSNGGGSNLVPSGAGSDTLNGNDLPAGPHRKVLDGDDSDIRHKMEEAEQHPVQNDIIASPTKKSEVVVDKWKGDPDHHQQGVAPPPADPNAPGAGGKPYKVIIRLS